MKRRNKTKHKEIISAEYAEIENLLKSQIEAVEKIPNSARRLLEYQALKEDAEAAYKKTDVIEGGVEKFSKENGRKYVGWFAGYMVGGMGGVYAGFGIASLLTGGFAALAIIPGVAIVSVGMYAGTRLGKKWGRARYYKLPPERRHATRMHDMVNGLSASINDLKTFFKKEENIKAQKDSAIFEDVKAKFPDIMAAFKQYADKTAAHENLRNRSRNDNGARSLRTPSNI